MAIHMYVCNFEVESDDLGVYPCVLGDNECIKIRKYDVGPLCNM